jgi:hypothetical protein
VRSMRYAENSKSGLCSIRILHNKTDLVEWPGQRRVLAEICRDENRTIPCHWKDDLIISTRNPAALDSFAERQKQMPAADYRQA